MDEAYIESGVDRNVKHWGVLMEMDEKAGKHRAVNSKMGAVDVKKVKRKMSGS